MNTNHLLAGFAWAIASSITFFNSGLCKLKGHGIVFEISAALPKILVLNTNSTSWLVPLHFSNKYWYLAGTAPVFLYLAVNCKRTSVCFLEATLSRMVPVPIGAEVSTLTNTSKTVSKVYFFLDLNLKWAKLWIEME